MQIENLTNPGASPITGDLVKITHDSGATEEKLFHVETPAVSQYNNYTYAEFIEQLTETELDDVFALKRGAQGVKVERFLEVIKARNSVDFNIPRTLVNMQSLVPAVFADQARVAEITGAI